MFWVYHPCGVAVYLRVGGGPVGVLDRQPTKVVPEVDVYSLAEIGNSKETGDTQFR
jgi:hypothetical protein